MKFSRLTATAVASLLVLSGCTGEDETPTAEPTTSSAGDGTGASSDGAADEAGATTEDAAATVTAPLDDAGATSTAPGDDASVTTQMVEPTDDAGAAGKGVLTLDEATEIALGVLTAAEQAKGQDGKKMQANVDAAYRGETKVAALAANKLEKVTGEPKARDLVANPIEPNVLAISRADGTKPHLILVQTVAGGQVPELHLLESTTGRAADYRITWSAPMLPGSEVAEFAPRSEGTPVIRKGRGELKARPEDSLRALADYLRYPTGGGLRAITTNGYAPAVREAAATQAAAVSEQARLRERNYTDKKATRTLEFVDGSALVMGVLNRTTTFLVKENSVLNPPEVYRVFDDQGELSQEAVLRTKVFVGLHVPARGDDVRPELVAVREQPYAADGS